MNITATAVIQLMIEQQEFKLTRSQAEALYNTLGQALGKTTGALNRHTGVTECQPTTPRWFDNEFVY